MREKIGNMCGKRLVICCLMAAMLGGTATGCADSVQTDEQIVVPRDEGSNQNLNQEQDTQTDAGQSDGEQSQDADKEGKGAIAEQVQAPEHFTAEMSGEHIHVKADAEVIIPNAEGFKTYKVTSRAFDQGDYASVSKVLLGGEELWERDYDAMAGSNGFTRSEIEQRIEKIKEQAEDGGKLYEEEAKGRTYDEAIAAWEALLETAPEEPVLVEVPAAVVDPESEEAQEKGEAYLSGYVTLNGEDYYVSLDNGYQSDWMYVNFRIQKGRNGYYGMCSYNDLTDKAKQDINFSVEEIKEKAKGQMEAMGFADFVDAGEEYLVLYDSENNQETTAGDVGYAIHFTRELDGIPVTYTLEDGGEWEKDSIAWNYEKIELAYDADGLLQFEWSNPYMVEKTSDEYLFLLPFSEIQTVFENMMIKKYEDDHQKTFGDQINDMIDIEINEVRLGYMRVRETGDATEGTMVPVWDFFGTQTYQYEDGQAYTEDIAYNSLLTINALDGTIIDRGLGY